MLETLKYLLLLFVFFLAGCNTFRKDDATLEPAAKSDTLVTIGNNTTKLTFSLLGGSLVNFEDATIKVNPFAWKETNRDTALNGRNGAILQGQYISFGRWSFPSPGESKLGMPVNGEPANNWWKLEPKKSNSELTMSCEAPLDGFSINRHVVMAQSGTLFKVTETITNENSTGRTLLLMQNLMLVPPFFDPLVEINSNASFGYNQLWGLPEPERFEYKWSYAYMDTLKISATDIRTFSTRFRYLSSHVFTDSIGWVTLYNPRLKVILGYVWKTNEYPWVHFKNEINYGKSHMQSIAFGTSGLSDIFSYEERMSATFHEKRNFDFVDAKSSIQKSWYCFLISEPAGYQKIIDITTIGDQLVLHVLASDAIRKEIKLSL